MYSKPYKIEFYLLSSKFRVLLPRARFNSPPEIASFNPIFNTTTAIISKGSTGNFLVHVGLPAKPTPIECYRRRSQTLANRWRFFLKAMILSCLTVAVMKALPPSLINDVLDRPLTQSFIDDFGVNLKCGCMRRYSMDSNKISRKSDSLKGLK